MAKLRRVVSVRSVVVLSLPGVARFVDDDFCLGVSSGLQRNSGSAQKGPDCVSCNDTAVYIQIVSAVHLCEGLFCGTPRADGRQR